MEVISFLIQSTRLVSNRPDMTVTTNEFQSTPEDSVKKRFR